MRFSEHELTAALTGAAKTMHAGRGRRRRDPDAAWEALGRYQRFQLLDGLGTQILPVLVALPDVEVAVGAQPTYADAEVAEVVAELLGSDGTLGRVRRAVVVKARTALVQLALAHVPPRLDPDGLLHSDGA